MARPLSCCCVYRHQLAGRALCEGSLFSNGLDQLLSTSGGTTVVSRPPMKKKTSAATTKPTALLSVFPSMAFSLWPYAVARGGWLPSARPAPWP